MGKDYRATEIEWEFLEDHFASIEEHVPFMHQMNEVLSRRLLELRARIEALEAAQQQPDHLPDATEMVNTGWRNLHDLSPIMEPAPTRPDPPAPAGGLVDGICRELPLSPGEARAVVRVVAAWLRSDGPDWPSVASLLEKEANQ